MSASLANRLSLSLDESQEGQAPAGPNILQYNDAGWDDENGEDGHFEIKHLAEMDFVKQKKCCWSGYSSSATM